MKQRRVIFGIGDIAQLAHFHFSRDSDYEVVAFSVYRLLGGEASAACRSLPLKRWPKSIHQTRMVCSSRSAIPSSTRIDSRTQIRERGFASGDLTQRPGLAAGYSLSGPRVMQATDRSYRT
jgi:hypothetical protein